MRTVCVEENDHEIRKTSANRRPGAARRSSGRRLHRQFREYGIEARDVSGFNEIVLLGSGEVIVDVTGTDSLEIEAEDNVVT